MVEYDTLNPEHGYNKRKELGGGAVKFSEDARRNMSEAQKGEKNWNFKKPRSEEHCRRIAAANKGRKHTEEARKNMSKAQKESKLSEEYRRRVSESMKGVPLEKNMKNRYLVFSPSGDAYAVKGLAAFCRVFEISQGNLSEVVNGIRSHTKGYKAQYMTPEERTRYEPLFTDGIYYVKFGPQSSESVVD